MTIVASLVFALPNSELNPANKKANLPFVVPVDALEVAPGVFDLGTKEHNGRQVQGYAFVHGKKNYHHRDGHGGGPGGGGPPNNGGETCFTVLAKGAKWKATEDYVMDNSFASETGLGVTEWSTNGFSFAGVRDTSESVDPAAFGDLNDKNEIMFGADNPNTIAVTITWGFFNGPPGQRELVEWDMRFNNVDFAFGNADVDANVMDYQNIFTHEFGHALGLGHSGSTCTEETMYGFASEGETKKRTLAAGDIAGVNSLYA